MKKRILSLLMALTLIITACMSGVATKTASAANGGAITFEYRYGTDNLIQVNTNLPASTPCANFLSTDNGCVIDESGNTVQWIAWIGMDNVDGTIVLTFHYNNAFTAGQTYVLPKDSVWGFTDGNTYTLDKDYTFTFDGSNWSVEAKEEIGEMSMEYRYGTDSLIQVNTSLPATTAIANFLATDNGCNITQSGAQVFGWAGMENVDGTVVITFHFNNAFTAGQTYTLAAGSVFGFTDGTKYSLTEDYTFTFNGTDWTEPTVPDEPEIGTLSFEYSYGTSTVIQVKTNLPSTTPVENFTVNENGCSVDESGNTVQWVGWIGMATDDAGVIYLAFNFNNAFTEGQTYVLPQGAIFGFVNGDKYALDKDYTFTFNGTDWAEPVPHTCAGTLVPEVKATCTETGNIAYWICECGKIYADEACTEEINSKDIIVPAGHVGEAVPAVAATTTKEGHKAGTKCSVCGEILTGCETIPKIVKKVTKPAATKITKATGGKKKITIKFKKVSGISGYEIQIATKKNMKKGLKTFTVKASKAKYVAKKLKAKIKYWVRIRTYKVVNGEKIVSSWSAKKTVKTK